MKLVSLYVSSFGKLKDFSFDFNDNFNVIKQENGWGKSTLATFIKCIFYGLSGGGKRSVSENERLKYKPWNSTEKFGGHIVFSWGGKTFKIERYFGLKESDDTIALIDVETGKSFNNVENLGKRIFEIDEEGFLSTTFFAQKEFTVKSNTSITSKYNSVCEIQSVEAFDDAVKKLEEKAKELKSRGDKGKINEKRQELFNINEDIAEANRAGALLNRMNQAIVTLEDETNELKAKRDQLSKKVGEFGEKKALLEKKKNYQELLAQKGELTIKRQEILKKVNGKAPVKSDIVENYNLASDIFSHEKEKAEIVALANTYQTGRTRNAKTNSNKLWMTMLILSALFVVGGIVSFVISQMLIGIISLIMAAGFGAFAIIYFSFSRRNYYEITKNRGQKMEEFQCIIDEHSKIISLNKIKIESYLSNFGLEQMEYSTALNYISDVHSELAVVDEKISFADSLLEKHDKHLIKRYETLSNDAKDSELDVDFKNAQSEYEKKYVELVNLKNEKNKYSQLYESMPELESKKAEIAEQLEALVEEHRILELTHQFMLKADENLKIKYRAPLKKSLNKYFSLITGILEGVEIDIDLNVTGVEKEGNKLPEYYSKGYQNLFEICKRFALTDVLFTGEKPFIILDDPFYNLDDEKIKTSLALIKELSNEYQIIYFVCHESRVI